MRTERTPMTTTDFAKEMFRLEAAEGEKVTALVYGDSNAGKTRLAGTAPGKTFWLVAEPGYKSASRAGARGVGRAVTDPATAWAAIEYLEQRSPKTGKARYELFDWLIVDGTSTMQDKIRIGYAQEAFDINSKTRQHRNLPDRPDYFNTQNMFKTWVSRLADMPINVLITAHAYRTERGDADELLVFPGFQGKINEVSNAISGLMDITAYMEVKELKVRGSEETKEVRRLWFTNPKRNRAEGLPVRYIAGDKFDGVLGPYMDNPTIPRIMAKINGEGE